MIVGATSPTRNTEQALCAATGRHPVSAGFPGVFNISHPVLAYDRNACGHSHLDLGVEVRRPALSGCGVLGAMELIHRNHILKVARKKIEKHVHDVLRQAVKVAVRQG